MTWAYLPKVKFQQDQYNFQEILWIYIAHNVHVFDPLHVLIALYIVFIAWPVSTKMLKFLHLEKLRNIFWAVY